MPPRATRTDAVANRERIVEVARRSLAESNGTRGDLALHLVAKAAGVGQGTLYRHFPTREHLLAAVYREEIADLADLVPALLASSAPIDALAAWFERLVVYARVKRGVVAAIEASAWVDLYADEHHRIDDALTALLEQGKAAGDVRPDADTADVLLLLGALSRIPADEWDERSVTIVAVIVDGVRRRS